MENAGYVWMEPKVEEIFILLSGIITFLLVWIRFSKQLKAAELYLHFKSSDICTCPFYKKKVYKKMRLKSSKS